MFNGFTLGEAHKIIKGVEIKTEAEEDRWLSEMQLLRLVGVTIQTKPVYGYKKPRQISPEQYFGLPGDKKQNKVPQLTKEQFIKAQKKVKLLKGWQ